MPFGKLKQINEFMAQKQSADQASRQAVEAAQTVNQPNPMPSATPASAPTAAPQQAPRVNTDPLRGGFQQMGEFNPQKPVLQKRDPNEMYKATRSQALGHEANLADPQKAQEFWNASGKEFWGEQVKRDPTSIYAAVNEYLASNETPEEKRKRERREALGEVFNNLGNLIGNAANLYYTHRGGQYIDLNAVNEKHRARMEKIKEKQDALDEQRKKIILNAKLGDIKADRAEKLADKKAKADADADALKHKREMVKLAIQNAYKLGQIDAQTAADLLKNADKATKDAELENLRQSGRVALKGMKSGDAKANDEKVLTSLTGADGNVYTRNSKLDNVEMRELAKYIEDWSPYTTVDEDGKETIDYIGAIADAAESGLIPTEVLEQRGYKKGKSSGKKSIEGFGESNKSSNKKTISGF